MAVKAEHYALDLLPAKVAAALYEVRDKQNGAISEIRIRADHRIRVTVGGREYLADCIMTAGEIGELVFSLCGSSMYAHADTINRGYISLPHGIRVGVCGHAVTDGGKITAVRSFSSLCIRIPRRCPGAGQAISDALSDCDVCSGVLVYSPPGVGKTTALREYCAAERDRRIAVIDTRSELGFAAADSPCCDILDGYPRSVGIECALRSLAPDVIVCDEIGSDADKAALMSCAEAGVSFVCSAHGSDADGIMKRSVIAECFAAGLFDALIGLKRDENGNVTADVRYLG